MVDELQAAGIDAPFKFTAGFSPAKDKMPMHILEEFIDRLDELKRSQVESEIEKKEIRKEIQTLTFQVKDYQEVVMEIRSNMKKTNECFSIFVNSMNDRKCYKGKSSQYLLTKAVMNEKDRLFSSSKVVPEIPASIADKSKLDFMKSQVKRRANEVETLKVLVST